MRMSNANGRQGTVLVCVLACLCTVTVVMIATVQSSLRNRQDVRTYRRMQQIEFMCEAGALRARDNLARQSSYSGEAWTPALKTMSNEQATIEIKCTPNEDNSTQQCIVTARLTESGTLTNPIQRTRYFTIQQNPFKEPK
ncbi:MAG: hypothetical protein ABL921_24425 [Pirellula sp.]